MQLVLEDRCRADEKSTELKRGDLRCCDRITVNILFVYSAVATAATPWPLSIMTCLGVKSAGPLEK